MGEGRTPAISRLWVTESSDRIARWRCFGSGRNVPSLCRVSLRHALSPLRAASLDGIWAATSLMHLPMAAAVQLLIKLHRRVGSGGVLAATVTYGVRSRILERGWIPGRYFARWRKSELARALRSAGWEIVMLRVVINQERKGRWLNLLVRRPFVWLAGCGRTSDKTRICLSNS